MTQLGTPIPREIVKIRRALERSLRKRNIKTIDANSTVTGRDFLLKIWELIVECPLGIAIVSGDVRPSTLANIFYEVGLLHAFGKETLVIKTSNAVVPSDFIRTEYIEYDSRRFAPKMEKFLNRFFEQATHYQTLSDQLEQNPALMIDYLKRAYLMTGERRLLTRVRAVKKSLGTKSDIRQILHIP